MITGGEQREIDRKIREKKSREHARKISIAKKKWWAKKKKKWWQI